MHMWRRTKVSISRVISLSYRSIFYSQAKHCEVVTSAGHCWELERLQLTTSTEVAF